jgi:5-methyltetrahydrofolate--homocysteine methyltransferase
MIVGGAPLTEKFAKEIGADGYAPDAASAVDKVKELLHSK